MNCWPSSAATAPRRLPVGAPAAAGSAPAAAYAAPLPVPGGTLDVDDPWYLARPTDATALALIRQPGQTLTIKGPRQMGKSSLLMRTVKAGMEAGKRVALLDFQLVDEDSKAHADVFFRRFASWVAEQLNLPDSVDKFWNTGYSSPQNCTRYMEQHVLEPLGGPCIVAIDETDAIFQTTFSQDFFSMLRSWHNRRADPMRRSWKKLDIILSTSTEPQFFIDRPHESPFNVGVTLRLEDFRAGAGRAPERDPSATARVGRRRAPVPPRPRTPVSDAQGAVHGGRQHADLQRRRAVRHAPRTTADRSAITCATTCCGCSGRRS